MQTKKRISKITEILNELNQLKNNTINNRMLYAIQENIIFFKSAKTIPAFISWLIRIAPKLDGTKLLEINDLLPKYDTEVHSKLIEMERRPKPGLIKPAFDRIISYIKDNNSNLILASFGSGGMELERQIMDFLLKKNFSKKILFVAIDQSSLAHQISKNNYKELGDNIESYDFDECAPTDLEYVIKVQQKTFAFIHCKNDIFSMPKIFYNKVFNLSYHTHFKHHLTNFQKNQLDQVVDSLSEKVIEYDGFLNWIGMIPQTFIGWDNPVFLNAEILSNLRYFKKPDIIRMSKEKHPESHLTFSKLGFYVLEYNT